MSSTNIAVIITLAVTALAVTIGLRLSSWEPGPTFYLIVFPLAAGTFLLTDSFLDRRRGRAFRRLAPELGLAYLEEAQLPPQAPFFPLFRMGAGGRPYQTATGPWRGGEAWLCDYEYCESGGRTYYFYQTIAMFRRPGLSLPGLLLRPEAFSDRITALFGHKDIDFAEDPRFSAQYFLRGLVEGEVRALLQGGDRLDFLARHPGWNIEAGGEWLLVYQHKRTIPSGRLKSFFADCAEIAEKLAP